MAFRNPETQAADALECFHAWWEEGFKNLESYLQEHFSDVVADLIKTIAQGAYLQGQIDGADRAFNTITEVLGHALGIETCRFCGTAFSSDSPSPDPITHVLGRLCQKCFDDQAEARDVLE